VARYQEADDGEWFALARRGNRIACCDCGLVHVVDARLRDGTIELAFARNERATALTRRQSAYRCRPSRRR
jgi:hypothetical protein